MMFFRKYRQALHARQYRLLDNINSAVFVITAEGDIVYYNTALVDIFENIKTWLPFNNIAKLSSYNFFDFYLDPDKQRRKCTTGASFPVTSLLDIGNEIIFTHIAPLKKYSRDNRLIVTWQLVTREKNQERWEAVVEEQIGNVSEELSSASNELLKESLNMQETAESSSNHALEATSFLKSITDSIMAVAVDVTSSSANINIIAENVDENRNMNEAALAQSQDAREQITVLEELASSISVTVQLIQEITAQTHVLSLNANVEAARAGQAGAGFAVIANEIGALAKQTGTMSQTITQNVEHIRGTIPLSLNSIKTVESMVQEMNSTTISIHDLMEKETAKMETIKQRMDVASANSEQIIQRMDEIVGYSNNSLLQIETNRSIGDKIESIADLFNVIVGRFKGERIVTPNDIYHLLAIIENLVLGVVESQFTSETVERAKNISVQRFTGKKPKDVLKTSMENYQLLLKVEHLPPEDLLFPKGMVTPTQTYSFLLKMLGTVEKVLVKKKCTTIDQLKIIRPVTGMSPDHAYGLAYKIQQILQSIVTGIRAVR